MDNTNYIALSRQMALWKQMDVVSNNMANMNTSGYKGNEAVFTTYLAKTENAAKGIVGNPLYFTEDYGTYKNFSEGMIAHTGNALDVAIKGDAFFAVETADGEKYTRKGQFSLSSDGSIVTNDGYPLLSENRTPFYVGPNDREISITSSGEILTENGSLGRMRLASFADNQKLQKIADTLFENTDGNTVEYNGGNYEVIQKAVEKSNVEPISEMTKLINIQRSYEYVQQMIDTEHERLSNTISAFAQMA